MTNEEAARVLREMRDAELRFAEVMQRNGLHYETFTKKADALTAALAALDGDDAKALELADAEVAALRKDLDAALEDRARLRERIEAMRTRFTGPREYVPKDILAANKIVDAVLDAVDVGEPPAWYDPHTVANATMKAGEPPKGKT